MKNVQRFSLARLSNSINGNISLIAVPHLEPDLETLNRDLATRSRNLARDQMRANPELAKKVMRILAD